MNTQILDIFDITKDKLNIEKSSEVVNEALKHLYFRLNLPQENA